MSRLEARTVSPADTDGLVIGACRFSWMEPTYDHTELGFALEPADGMDQVLPHPLFERRGTRERSLCPISHTELALGKSRRPQRRTLEAEEAYSTQRMAYLVFLPPYVGFGFPGTAGRFCGFTLSYVHPLASELEGFPSL